MRSQFSGWNKGSVNPAEAETGISFCGTGHYSCLPIGNKCNCRAGIFKFNDFNVFLQEIPVESVLFCTISIHGFFFLIIIFSSFGTVARCQDEESYKQNFYCIHLIYFYFISGPAEWVSFLFLFDLYLLQKGKVVSDVNLIRYRICFKPIAKWNILYRRVVIIIIRAISKMDEAIFHHHISEWICSTFMINISKDALIVE